MIPVRPRRIVHPPASHGPYQSGLIAPRRGGDEITVRRCEGTVGRKPWDYRCTAVIPVLDTPDQLSVCVEVLRAQSERPYIVVIDTGSLPGNLSAIEGMRADDLEVHQIRSHAWRHPSEPVAVACQLGQDLARSEFVFQTHCDCFLRKRTALQELADLASVHKVVGFQLSPRPYAGWETELGHTALMMHVPSTRAIGWNMGKFCARSGNVPADLNLSPNRPDTESEFNASLADAGIAPLILAGEENYKRNVNEWFDHPRSFCCSFLYSPEYHARIAPEMADAMREARERVILWRASE